MFRPQPRSRRLSRQRCRWRLKLRFPPSLRRAAIPLPKDANEKTLGLVMHLIPLAGFLLTSISIPFGNVIAPLVFWLVKKAESPYLDAHGKEVLNFQINVSVLSIVGFILSFVCIGIPMLIALGITAIVLIVMAAIKVNEGQFYRYPWIYRIIK